MKCKKEVRLSQQNSGHGHVQTYMHKVVAYTKSHKNVYGWKNLLSP